MKTDIELGVEIEMLVSLQEEWEKGRVFSQAEAARKMGVSDRTIRNWMADYQYIYYWCLDRLLQNGQFTGQGLLALYGFQVHLGRKAIGFKNGKPLKQKNGAPKLVPVKNRLTVLAYAEKIWGINKVPANPQPYVSGDLDPATKQAVKEIQANNQSVIDAEIEAETESEAEAEIPIEYLDADFGDAANTITTLVFSGPSGEVLDGQLDDWQDDINSIVSSSEANLSGFTKQLLSKAAYDGRVLGTLSGKTLLASMQQAQASVLAQAAGINSGVANAPEAAPVTKRTRTTK